MKTKEQIIIDLRDKVSQIMSIPANTVEKSENFWELFPRATRITPKKTREFIEYIVNEYKIYLTDNEWESKVNTLSKLADRIIEKQSNPKHMLAQIRKELADRKSSYKQTLLLLSVIFGGYLILYTIINYIGGTLRESLEGKSLHVLLMLAALMGLAELMAVFFTRADERKLKDQVSPILQYYNTNVEENPSSEK